MTTMPSPLALKALGHTRDVTVTGTAAEIANLLASAQRAGVTTYLATLPPTVDGRLCVALHLEYPTRPPVATPARAAITQVDPATMLVLTTPRPAATARQRRARPSRRRRAITIIAITVTVLALVVAAVGYAVAQLVVLDLNIGAAGLVGFTALALLLLALLGGNHNAKTGHCPGPYHR